MDFFYQFIDVIRTCYHDRKKRSIIILVVSIFVFIWVVAGVTSNYIFPSEEEKAKKGSLSVYCCRECGFKKEVREVRGGSFYCDKCSKRMAQFRKCKKCDFEFPQPLPIKPPEGKKLTQMELFTIVNENRKCPNCGSVRTTTITRMKDVGKKLKY